MRSVLFMCVVLLAGSVGAAETPTPDAQASSTRLPSGLPFLRREEAVSSPSGAWWSPVALLAILGAGGAWASWRRRQRGPADASPGVATRHVVRISSQALTTHASVHVVRWNGEELLVGCTPQQLQVLARRTELGMSQEDRK